MKLIGLFALCVLLGGCVDDTALLRAKVDSLQRQVDELEKNQQNLISAEEHNAESISSLAHATEANTHSIGRVAELTGVLK